MVPVYLKITSLIERFDFLLTFFFPKINFPKIDLPPVQNAVETEIQDGRHFVKSVIWLIYDIIIYECDTCF